MQTRNKVRICILASWSQPIIEPRAGGRSTSRPDFDFLP
jgi:hypothetical protein